MRVIDFKHFKDTGKAKEPVEKAELMADSVRRMCPPEGTADFAIMERLRAAMRLESTITGQELAEMIIASPVPADAYLKYRVDYLLLAATAAELERNCTALIDLTREQNACIKKLTGQL